MVPVNYIFTGSSCRYKVVGWMKKKFCSPQDAISHYAVSLTKCNSTQTDQSLVMCNSTQTEDNKIDISTQTEDTTLLLESKFTQTDSAMFTPSVKSCEKLQALSLEFARLCKDDFDLIVPEEYLVLSGAAMVYFNRNNRSNVLYNLAKGFGVLRADGSDTLFPMKKMPMGLIEYTSNFFIAENVHQVCIMIIL